MPTLAEETLQKINTEISRWEAYYREKINVDYKMVMIHILDMMDEYNDAVLELEMARTDREYHERGY